MNNLKLVLPIIIIFTIGAEILAQNRPIDILKKEEKIGITSMFRYTYREWRKSSNAQAGEIQFDSFRLWAQTEIADDFFASTQYRFYDGWRTPQHLWVGYKFEYGTLKAGQTWVPFGIDYQPYDDWGNIPFYVGLQDDYDYGITWKIELNDFEFDLGFFKNQQLSSDSRERYDIDIFSGDKGPDDLILKQKANQETNQFNFRIAYNNKFQEGNFSIGLSGLTGQLYNQSTNDMGSRLAYSGHFLLNYKLFHFSIQGTYYDYKQKLETAATADDKNFINVAGWNFAYEIPAKASMLSATFAADIINEKLTAHLNYSRLAGGSADATSWLFTGGLRSFWDTFELFAEVYYGRNDPQLSGDVSGYGRDGAVNDLRIDLRIFYKLSFLTESFVNN